LAVLKPLGRKGGGWRAKISAAAPKILSNFFISAPPVENWLAFGECCPAPSGFKIEFFAFKPKAGF